MLAGAGLQALWGGPRRHVAGLWLGGALMAGALVVGGLWRSAVGLAACAFVVGFANPLVNAAVQVIWQATVPPPLQGRVFATRRLVLGAALPVALVLAGPLSDGLFEPALQPHGLLAAALGPLFGVGPGRGVAVLLSGLGVLAAAVTAWSRVDPRVRTIDVPLPSEARAQAS
jgi:hypothetical protein